MSSQLAWEVTVSQLPAVGTVLLHCAPVTCWTSCSCCLTMYKGSNTVGLYFLLSNKNESVGHLRVQTVLLGFSVEKRVCRRDHITNCIVFSQREKSCSEWYSFSSAPCRCFPSTDEIIKRRKDLLGIAKKEL